MGIRRWFGWSVVVVIGVMFAVSSGAGLSIGAERTLVDSIKTRSDAGLEDRGMPTLEEVVAAPAFGVVGVVVDVEAGVGMWWGLEDGVEVRHVVDATDPMAQVSTVHLTMDVDRLVFGAPPEDTGVVRLALLVDPESRVKTAVDLFRDRRMFAVAVPAGEPFHDTDLYAVALDGGLLAWTDTDRSLDFALAGDRVRATLGLDDLTTSELRDLSDG